MFPPDLTQINHTGRELELLCAGTKPLAWFIFSMDYEQDLYVAHRAQFAPLVDSGRLVEASYDETLTYDPKLERNLLVRTVLYALPEEAWRMPALRMILEVSCTHRDIGHNEIINRLMGRLLGYTEQEIEAFVAATSE